ncbi:hypothetical protein [Streptomyces mirabilis]|uniref:hypothetical protein n=1 Tax=Streptomyces mirabilis TaxID=68239 RepID=UPI003656D402
MTLLTVHQDNHPTPAEFFLTGCEQTGNTHYTLAAQWPRAHTFFTTPDCTHTTHTTRNNNDQPPPPENFQRDDLQGGWITPE